MCGAWGTLSIVLFATEGGLLTGDTDQLFYQLEGVVAVGIWCIVTGWILFNVIIKPITGLRVSKDEEMKGLDILEYGTEAYPGNVVKSGAAD